MVVDSCGAVDWVLEPRGVAPATSCKRAPGMSAKDGPLLWREKRVVSAPIEIVGTWIRASSVSLMTVSGRGRRNPSMACMSDATVFGLPLLRRAKRKMSTSSSGMVAPRRGSSLGRVPTGISNTAWSGEHRSSEPGSR